MIHPSYKDLLEVINTGAEEGDPIVSSRYSVVLATAKRARQIIRGSKPLVTPKCEKALSIAVQEVWEGKVKILGAGEEDDEFLRGDENELEPLDWESALTTDEDGKDGESDDNL
ncbi:MAG: DNA-directed RNA polymerase subunit omega [Lachnospiraceae bacterium]|nr:DNA-directed RNA polymerase subunit omega [Lachnospiraceae bacterium]